MAVMQNSIIFGGVNSADYGIYISGEGVFNAPKRDVEMISIPGRNGEFALDKGRFENIEVTYPAFNFEPDDYETFAQNLADFRNAICSLRGYQRLTDTFHPDEYRMATYIGGLEIKPVKYNTASEFNIVFDCKPQRWLTSGEDAVTVSDGETLTNPTLHEASPLLEVKGYGTIGFNGYEIELDNAVLGDIALYSGETYRTKYDTKQITINTTNLNTDDEIFVNSDLTASEVLTNTSGAHDKYIFNSVTSSTNVISAYCTQTSSARMEFFIVPDLSAGFAYGTSSTITSSATYSYRSAGSSTNYAETISMSVAYDGDDTITITTTRTGTLPANIKRADFYSVSVPIIYGYSTKSLLGNPTYIDCDLGEAYRIDGDTITSLNQHIDLGSDLPKLASGANEITYDNTITELKITPRWWRI